jgi:hypothetical protein
MLDLMIWNKVVPAHLENRDEIEVVVMDEPWQKVQIWHQDLAVVDLNAVELEKENLYQQTWDGAKLTRYKEAKKCVGEVTEQMST